ncbi:site-specific recombinase [Herbaspirillum sp. CF444]|uniref:site-specific recombinase n=1 Tax=Herbaspirillum sp. CF444 TaxID=1144319 RepID=UPI000272458C|nr:site-specific recombinase [Herbaspirillum sp. CF444]EJL94338.1 site-specific recombinase [Herbaspirillum sp. CF444]
MLHTLEKISASPVNAELDLLIELVKAIRPKKREAPELAITNVRTLTHVLQQHPHHAATLRHYLLHLLSVRRQTSLYTDIGILSNDGFFSELHRRIAYRILPPALDDRYLPDCLEKIFPFNTDYVWMRAVPSEDWSALFDVLAQADSELPDPERIDEQKTLTELLLAIQVLSYRISAIGIEPELIRIYSDVKAFESPFLMQNVELHRYLDGYMRHLNGDATPLEDASHVLVMLEQCQEVVKKIRNSTLRLGTSISVTYRLVRLDQHLDRLRKLLSLVDVGTVDTSASASVSAIAGKRSIGLELGLELIEAHNRKYTVRDLFAANINLLARNITENASRTGEHYIAEDRREYAAMYRSAAGAGFIIGFMSMIKILFSYLRAAPLVEAFLFSMNYSLGFMFIHVLHFTVATKQPAMTASRIAAGLHSRDGRNIDLDSLTELIVKVIRTQFVAVLGNLSIAFPVAYLLAYGYFLASGHHFVTPDKAQHLLHDIDPFSSLALFHAAIAGVCLFLAGLISGYYDNKALYTRMSQRVARARWLNSLLGKARTARLGDYLENGLGGLMGNFYFGILLGTIGTIGFLIGLPIDIRHITFSATNFAIALVGLDHAVSWGVIAVSGFGVLAIGTVNLWVSFSLALFVALRSRQVKFRHGWPLLKSLCRRFLKKPVDFFIPPKTAQLPEQRNGVEPS